MLALFKHCCCNSFTYHFSFDEVFSPRVYASYILTKRINNVDIEISRVPFNYFFIIPNRVIFLYLFENGIVRDFQNDFYATVPFRLRISSSHSFSSINFDNPYISFTNLLSYNPAIIDNSVSADLNLRSRIVDFLSSLDITSFYFPNSSILDSYALANFINQNFNHKIHIRFSCDVLHTSNYFPDFPYLNFSQILEVNNFNFEVNII